MTYQSVKGTKDILPEESPRWQAVENLVREVMELFAYREIRTPIFEETAVFVRSIGEDTDIVGKEMYTFTDKGGTSLTLRPEMTAPVIRAYLQHSLGTGGGVQKLYYMGPMFRQERPQAGRLRQFHQYGAECIGSSSPACDAEIIALAAHVYDRLDIPYVLKINSVGNERCRPRYREALRDFLTRVSERLTGESRRRMHTNPLRVLDSKVPEDIEATAEAPRMLDYLCDECREHFEAVRSHLENLDIPARVEPRLVRGLDYYTKTAFEFASPDLGAQDALGGGGRYDRLVEEFGGDSTPAVGFAAGFERLFIALERRGSRFSGHRLSVYLVGLDEPSRRLCLREALTLRRMGVSADCDFQQRSLKSQMREANKRGAAYTVIIGSEERERGVVTVKDMTTGMQETMELSLFRARFTGEDGGAKPRRD
ncbi:MAG: histidine--tRNA ligase [Bacteroidota bacterium]|nr:histidine--tRNA ligase [Bacteroidota bacterium]